MSLNRLYNEHVETPESDGFIAGHCTVYSEDGYFINVETDPFEGNAQMTLPVAVKVCEALRRAIEAAQSVQKKESTAEVSV